MDTFALIDKYAIVRTGIGCYLKTQLEEITLLESENISGLLKEYPDQTPDLIILGISQGTEMQNIGLIKTTKRYYPAAKIILYDEAAAPFYGDAGVSLSQVQATRHRLSPVNARPSVVLTYLREGVLGYLTKLNNLTDLAGCVQDVMKGKRYICSDVYESLIYQDFNKNEAQIRINNLSSREYEIASYLLEGLTTNGIALKVGRKATTISTIKNSIFKKLNVDNVLKLREVFYPAQATTAG